MIWTTKWMHGEEGSQTAKIGVSEMLTGVGIININSFSQKDLSRQCGCFRWPRPLVLEGNGRGGGPGTYRTCSWRREQDMGRIPEDSDAEVMTLVSRTWHCTWEEEEGRGPGGRQERGRRKGPGGWGEAFS